MSLNVASMLASIRMAMNTSTIMPVTPSVPLRVFWTKS